MKKSPKNKFKNGGSRVDMHVCYAYNTNFSKFPLHVDVFF